MGFLKDNMPEPDDQKEPDKELSSKKRLNEEMDQDAKPDPIEPEPESEGGFMSNLKSIVEDADLTDDERDKLVELEENDKGDIARFKDQDIAKVAEMINSLDESLVVAKQPKSTVTEAYRSLRTRLISQVNSNESGVIVLTSAAPREGKTVTTINMGLAFSEMAPGRVLVVEGDTRRPRFSKLLPSKSKFGLVHVLRNKCEPMEAVEYIADLNLSIVKAGEVANEEALQLLTGNKLKDTIELYRERFDYIIIDTPPVLSVADAGVFGKLSDLLILIVRMNRTSVTLVDNAINTLEGLNNAITGVLLTGYDPSKEGYGGYKGYGGYRYRYGYRRSYQYGYRYAYGEESDR